MRLVRVISGGQTGVDVGALRAAHRTGVPTGGTMPLGFRTLAGPRPQYRALYGMRESPVRAYEARTVANVVDAHATLRLASRWDTPGEACALRAVAAHDRKHLDVALRGDTPLSEEWDGTWAYGPARGWSASRSPQHVAAWILGMGGDVVLNVAGNSEDTAPGIEDASEAYLREVFVRVQVAMARAAQAAKAAKETP